VMETVRERVGDVEIETVAWTAAVDAEKLALTPAGEAEKLGEALMREPETDRLIDAEGEKVSERDEVAEMEGRGEQSFRTRSLLISLKTRVGPVVPANEPRGTTSTSEGSSAEF